MTKDTFDETFPRIRRLLLSKDRAVIPILAGPTAVGKSSMAVELVRASRPVPVEILSADAFQVYRGMDIGTAKPSRRIREIVPHHLIDVKDPAEGFSAGEFQRMAWRVLEEARERGVAILVVGGSGLYLEALTKGFHTKTGPDEALRAERLSREMLLERLSDLDPEAAARMKDAPRRRIQRALEIVRKEGRPLSEIQSGARVRPPFSFELFLLDLPRPLLYERIDARVDEMFKQGFVEEVRCLREKGVTEEMPSQKAIGYREVHSFLEGRITEEEMLRLVKRNTRRYAKRQLTWFRNRFQ